MFKRHQVLLTDWLTDFIRYLSSTYDLSFSEVIRLILSLYCGESIKHYYPEYEFPFSKEKIKENLEKIRNNNRLPEEQIHRTISQIYFESRKAIEYAMVQSDKQDRDAEE